MQLISLKASKINNRLWLTFSDNSYLPFFIDDVVKLSLSKNEQIDDSRYLQILNTSLTYLAREYALRQIALSPKTEKIIKQKLSLYFKKVKAKYKINHSSLNSSEIIDHAVKELIDKKLLNDQDYINYFVKRNYKKSKQQILYSLQQQGLSSDLLSEISFDQDSDQEKILHYLSKKKINIEDITDFNEKNKIKAKLYRQGFSLSDINSIFDARANFR